MAGTRLPNLMSVIIVLLVAVGTNFLKPVSARDGCHYNHLPETVLKKIVEAADATLSLYKRDPCCISEEQNSITDENERTNSHLLQETTAKLSEDISMLREDLQTLKDELQSVKELKGRELRPNDHDAIQRQLNSISQYKESTQQQLQHLGLKMENIFFTQQVWFQNQFEKIHKFQEDFVTELHNLKEWQENSLNTNQNEIYAKLESILNLQKETENLQDSLHDKNDNEITIGNNETHNQIEAMLLAQKETGNKLQVLQEKIDSEVIPGNHETRNNIVEIRELQHEIRQELRNISSHLDSLDDKNCDEMLWPRECSEIHQHGSGVYTIYPDTCFGKVVRAYCENEWTVILSREPADGVVEFNKSWIDYKEGIGDPEAEHWIGNEVLHKLTRSQPHMLRVDIEHRKGIKKYALYDTFSVADEANNYRLQVGGYSGDAGDSLGELNNAEFSTPDRDNDIVQLNCAERYSSGFWFKNCYLGHTLSPLMSKKSVVTGTIWSYRFYSHSTIRKIIFKIKPAIISRG